MTATAYTSRNAAIDILRALTMVLMVFVNDLWSISGYPHWFAHAKATQDMLGLSDIVFPCFLFVVGMSIPYALENSFGKGKNGVQIAGHILTRSLALLIMGVFLVNAEEGISGEIGINPSVYKLLLIAAFLLIWNVYPKTDKKSLKRLYLLLRLIGIALLVFLGIIFRNGEGGVLSPSWWGILGIIGWTYLLCAFIYFFTRDRLKYLIPIWALFLIWSMLKCRLRESGVPILDLPEGNALDAFTDILHIGTGAHCALTMGGVILSVLSVKYSAAKSSKRISISVGITAGLVLLGILSHQFWITSKIQATAPWVLYCSAISVGVYSVLVWLIEAGKENWFRPIKPAGTATLTCYLVPYILYSFFMLLNVPRFESISTGFIGVLSCILFSFLCVGVTYLLGKVYVKLKI